ncbi:MAG: PKD domain-containing protein, partial [Chloroflexota bacterium]|nr:PKD domain-containing protein [Chloroflexota bacterium]
PPAADAGVSQTVAPGAVVALDGSGSSDPDGDALTYGWAQTGGTLVTLSGSSAISPTFTAPDDPTVLIFTLTITDSFGLSDDAVTTVTVEQYHIYLPLVLRSHH